MNNASDGTTTVNYNDNEEDMQVGSGEISYHILSINPASDGFLDPNSQLGRDLSCLKFDLKQLKNSSTI